MYAEGHVMIDTERSNFEQNYIHSSQFYQQEESQEDQLNEELEDEDQQDSSTPNEGSEGEGDLEYYFSCHERMIKDCSYNKGSENISGVSKDDLKDNLTMPELSRSTLMDQIDYDLYNYKINESSMYESSGESAFISNKKN
jgi:hypothetical protein